MECSNKLKINEYVSINQLKRKIKAYLIDQGNSEFKPSIFAQGIVLSLVMVLEELVNDCIKNVVKDKTGLYTINSLVLKNLLYETDKYNFAVKYLRKYSNVTRYHDAVFFNIHKVMDNLENKLGSKLMIDTEPKNMICYLLLSLQYDILDLSVKMVKYANRKTLNNSVLEIAYSFMLSDEINSKIKLKLDSYNITNEEDDEDSGEDNGENVEDVVEGVDNNEDVVKDVVENFEDVDNNTKKEESVEIIKEDKELDGTISDKKDKSSSKKNSVKETNVTNGETSLNKDEINEMNTNKDLEKKVEKELVDEETKPKKSKKNNSKEK